MVPTIILLPVHGIKVDDNPHLTTPTRHVMVGIPRSKVIFWVSFKAHRRRPFFQPFRQVGFYQPNEGSLYCFKCPASRTTKTSRSASLMDCVCPQGSLRTSTDCVETSAAEDFISEVETSNAFGMLYFAWILLPTTWFAAF